MVSIKDVAGRAGVAISTVSKVLNHYPNVSSETRKKVEEAIRELNFVPNSVAAALSSKQAGRVALLLNLEEKTQITSEIGMQYLAGAMSCAMEHNLDVITVFSSMVRPFFALFTGNSLCLPAWYAAQIWDRGHTSQ